VILKSATDKISLSIVLKKGEGTLTSLKGNQQADSFFYESVCQIVSIIRYRILAKKT